MKKPPPRTAREQAQERIDVARYMEAAYGDLREAKGIAAPVIEDLPAVIRRRPRTGPSESQEQRAVIGWWNLACKSYGLPRFALFSIPNGAHLAGNSIQRAIQMNRLKAEGLRTGVPDLCLPIQLPGKSGLWIEMKVGTNKPSDEQRDFLTMMDWNGFNTAVCYSAAEAINAIKNYLEAK